MSSIATSEVIHFLLWLSLLFFSSSYPWLLFQVMAINSQHLFFIFCCYKYKLETQQRNSAIKSKFGLVLLHFLFFKEFCAIKRALIKYSEPSKASLSKAPFSVPTSSNQLYIIHDFCIFFY